MLSHETDMNPRAYLAGSVVASIARTGRLGYYSGPEVTTRPMLAAPRRYLIAVPRPLPAPPLVERRRYFIVTPGRSPRHHAMFFASF